MANLPEPLRHPSVARAAVGPTAVVAAGAGVAIGLFLAHSIVLAIVLGVVGWGLRMIIAAIRDANRRRAARPKPVDPWAVPDPWRTYVRQALAAQARYDQAVASAPPGALQDRLAALGMRVHHGVQEVWGLARQGAALSARPPQAIAQLPTADALSAELRRAQAERAAAARRGPSAATAALERREEALAAQLHAARRAEQVSNAAADRLRLLTARLDEAVSALVEAIISRAGPGFADQLAWSVSAVVDEIDSLRHGLAEAASPFDSFPAPQPLGPSPSPQAPSDATPVPPSPPVSA